MAANVLTALDSLKCILDLKYMTIRADCISKELLGSIFYLAYLKT